MILFNRRCVSQSCSRCGSRPLRPMVTWVSINRKVERKLWKMKIASQFTSAWS